MGFYSELQMELDDYEARYGRKADWKALDSCTKKVHAERKINELTWRVNNLILSSTYTREQVIQHCIDIKSILLSTGHVA